MNAAVKALNITIQRLRSLGIDVIKVMDMEFDNPPVVYFGDLEQFLEQCRRRAKEVFYQRLPPSPIEGEQGDEIDDLIFFFMHNGVCNVLELGHDGVMDRY